MEEDSRPNKTHRKRQSGKKAEKKKAKNKHEQELTPRQRNPKAFSIQKAAKTLRTVQRTQDIKTKKQHVPMVDRTPVEPPPVVVAVVGPPKVGKSTLLRCVVKNFTKQKLTKIQGPVTVVSGKHRRLTLIECNNDINAMIDVAKVADLVLLLVDASFGFEMETFEFLNICQVHGFPRIMGVLTHLDTFRDNKRQRKTKKRLKHRFWTEVHQGAKLFYLSGMVHGEYQKTEVHNLCRFISVMKFRPLIWRTTHPYLLADRMEDITDPEKIRQSPKADRNISLYGYVHGTHMKNNINVHIPGCGDYSIRDMQFLNDPCPLPGAERKKTLSQKERMIYAPMSGVGGIVYDKDAVYIDLGGPQNPGETQEEVKPANELVSSLLTMNEPVDKKMSSLDVDLFSDNIKQTAEGQKKSDYMHKVVRTNDVNLECDIIHIKYFTRVTVGYKKYEGHSEIWNIVSHREGKKSELIQMKDGSIRRLVKFDENNMDSSNDDDDDDDEDDDDDDDDDLEEDDNADSDEGIQKDLTPPPKKKAKKEAEAEGFAFADTDDELEEPEHIQASHSKQTKSDKIADKNKRSIDIRTSKVKSDTDEKTDKMKDSDDDDDDGSEDESDSSDEDDDYNAEEEEDASEDKIENSSGRKKAKTLTFSEEVVVLDSDSDDDTDADLSDDDEDDANTKSDGRLDDNTSAGGSLASRLVSLSQVEFSKMKKTNTSYSELDIPDSAKSKYKYLTQSGKDGDDDIAEGDIETILGNTADQDQNTEDAMESDEEEEEDEEEGLQWKSNLAAQAAEAFRQRQASRINYRKLVYGQDEAVEEREGDNEDEIGGLFRVLREKSEKTKTDRLTINKTDCSKSISPHTKDLDVEQLRDLIEDCFVSGKWDKSEDAAFRLQQDDDIFGDFEDLETGEVHAAPEDMDDDDEDDSGDDDKPDNKDKDKGDGEERKKKSEMTAAEKRADKKRKLKEMFDTVYDMKGDTEYYDTWKSEMEDQAKMNKSEFENLDDETRVQYEGYRPGMYVRIEVHDMPCEFVTNFDPTYPLVMGGLLSAENNIGYVQTRIKKHRWHKKILKTRNPLIFSVGWRRFQSIPLYSIQDHNLRNRLLKYTPEHLHCQGSFWGPITPQGTGVLAVESVAGVKPGFRIAATGVILELDKSMQIVKKLKLTGTPLKVFSKSAFIQGMFNSSLEVSKFEGASIRTVSGIRGQIKKVAKTPEGAYRAKFEDKILMSDIVFLRTWYPVAVPQFYNPVTNLLMPEEEKQSWQGMKTVGQLRREKGMATPTQEDSKYKRIERKGKTYNPLVIPKSLQQSLPFKDTPKVLPGKKDPIQRVAVIREPHEVKIAKMMKMLKELTAHKERTERVQMRERVKKHRKKMKQLEQTRSLKQKEVKKMAYRTLGKLEEKNKKKMQD